MGRVKSIRVGDLMTTDVVTISPQTHLLTILDIMLKRHIRRLPVVSDQEVVGIVSKTDMAGAYYAGLPVETPLDAIVVGPLHTCYEVP